MLAVCNCRFVDWWCGFVDEKVRRHCVQGRLGAESLRNVDAKGVRVWMGRARDMAASGAMVCRKEERAAECGGQVSVFGDGKGGSRVLEKYVICQAYGLQPITAKVIGNGLFT